MCLFLIHRHALSLLAYHIRGSILQKVAGLLVENTQNMNTWQVVECLVEDASFFLISPQVWCQSNSTCRSHRMSQICWCKRTRFSLFLLRLQMGLSIRKYQSTVSLIKRLRRSGDDREAVRKQWTSEGYEQGGPWSPYGIWEEKSKFALIS